MSRSYKHFPGGGWTTARSEKDDKRLDHRHVRARARQALKHEDYERAEYDVRMSVWKFAKDGKQFWPRPADEDRLESWKKWMRK